MRWLCPQATHALEHCARGLLGAGARAQWMARQELRGALWGPEKDALATAESIPNIARVRLFPNRCFGFALVPLCLTSAALLQAIVAFGALRAVDAQ